MKLAAALYFTAAGYVIGKYEIDKTLRRMITNAYDQFTRHTFAVMHDEAGKLDSLPPAPPAGSP